MFSTSAIGVCVCMCLFVCLLLHTCCVIRSYPIDFTISHTNEKKSVEKGENGDGVLENR